MIFASVTVPTLPHVKLPPTKYHLSLLPSHVFGKIIQPADLLLLAFLGVVGGLYWLVGFREGKNGRTGGTGRVVGVVGRMGSGKSYFAVRMAYRRLCAGSNVCTNFTMHLRNHDEDDNCLDGVEYTHLVESDRWGEPDRMEKATHYCPCKKIKGSWRQFHGWEDFAQLENCVVIIDEVHLYAPSNKTLTFPGVARWKMSMARKYKLDVYWISQHENRVNSILKDLTSHVYLCSSFLSGLFFMAVGYEPEKMRRPKGHLDRLIYRFDPHIAGLYDSMQVLEVDEHLLDEKGMELVASETKRHNEKRGVQTARINGPEGFRGLRRCAHERDAHTAAGTCQEGCRVRLDAYEPYEEGAYENGVR